MKNGVSVTVISQPFISSRIHHVACNRITRGFFIEAGTLRRCRMKGGSGCYRRQTETPSRDLHTMWSVAASAARWICISVSVRADAIHHLLVFMCTRCVSRLQLLVHSTYSAVGSSQTDALYCEGNSSFNMISRACVCVVNIIHGCDDEPNKVGCVRAQRAGNHSAHTYSWCWDHEEQRESREQKQAARWTPTTEKPQTKHNFIDYNFD